MSVFQHFQHQFAGNVAIVDYESEYQKADKVKYRNYLTGIANRYQREKKDCPVLRMVVAYTGDVERRQVADSFDIGAVKMHIETAFLSELDKDGISRRLAKKDWGQDAAGVCAVGDAFSRLLYRSAAPPHSVLPLYCL
ncbi:MAG: hypothetical protein K2N87_00005 [Eubacterium sp.]|nr:hypothetical protein [Eubacterium sp.]